MDFKLQQHEDQILRKLMLERLVKPLTRLPQEAVEVFKKKSDNDQQ